MRLQLYEAMFCNTNFHTSVVTFRDALSYVECGSSVCPLRRCLRQSWSKWKTKSLQMQEYHRQKSGSREYLSRLRHVAVRLSLSATEWLWDTVRGCTRQMDSTTQSIPMTFWLEMREAGEGGVDARKEYSQGLDVPLPLNAICVCILHTRYTIQHFLNSNQQMTLKKCAYTSMSSQHSLSNNLSVYCRT